MPGGVQGWVSTPTVPGMRQKGHRTCSFILARFLTFLISDVFTNTSFDGAIIIESVTKTDAM